MRMSRVDLLGTLHERSVRRGRQIDEWTEGTSIVQDAAQPILQVKTSYNFQMVGPAGWGPVYIGYRTNLFHMGYEPLTTFLTLVATNDGGTFLDIGASYGYFSLLAACNGRRPVTVYAFEPVPSYYELLVRNIGLNRQQDRIHPIDAGLGDVSGAKSIAVAGPSSSFTQGWAGQGYGWDGRTEEVQIARLDELLAPEDLAPPIVLKIDVEGFEAHVIKGAQGLLQHPDTACIIIEIMGPQVNPAALETVRQLQAFGFHCLGPMERGPVGATHSRLAPFEEIMEEGPEGWPEEWVCVRDGHPLSEPILRTFADVFALFVRTGFLSDAQLEVVGDGLIPS